MPTVRSNPCRYRPRVARRVRPDAYGSSTQAYEEAFGRRVEAMIDERRLLDAKRLLLFTVRSVEDISLIKAGIPGERFLFEMPAGSCSD